MTLFTVATFKATPNNLLVDSEKYRSNILLHISKRYTWRGNGYQYDFNIFSCIMNLKPPSIKCNIHIKNYTP